LGVFVYIVLGKSGIHRVVYVILQVVNGCPIIKLEMLTMVVSIFVSLLFLIVSTGNAGVVINEIMYNPESNEDNAEYIELYNATGEDIDMSGWELTGGVDFEFPVGVVIGRGDYLLVCRNELFIRQRYNLSQSIATVGNYAPSRLSNSGESFALEDRNGKKIDEVSYMDRSPWPTEPDGNGQSLELIHPLVDNYNFVYWRSSFVPSPGRQNSRYVTMPPPRLERIERIPLSPTSGDTVRIKAFFSKEDDLSSVTLEYRINNGAQVVVTMEKDGLAYTGQIPVQPQQTVVSYAVRAVNQQNETLLYPYTGLQPMLMYRVEDNPVESGRIVINEIMYKPSPVYDEEVEWIELLNPMNQAVDLSYWVVKDDNDDHIFRIPAGTTIGANGYLIVASDLIDAGGVPVVPGLSFSLANNGDAVRLFDPNEREIASVYYNDSGEWPLIEVGYSLELVQVSRLNGEPNNWGSSRLGGSPGRPNDRMILDTNYQDFAVVINELFYHPEDEEVDNNIAKEFVELHNTGTVAVDVGGWFFSRGIEYRFPEGTVIPANGYLLVCKDETLYPHVANKVGPYALRLDNGGEKIALTNAEGIVIDYVNYDDRYPWPVLPDGDGFSLELMNPTVDNRNAQFWSSGMPMSPGAKNGIYVDNAPPRITRVNHSPAYPSASITGQEVQTLEIIKEGAIWKYRKGTRAFPIDWKTLAYVDSAWEEGPAGFGYDDGDDATILTDMRYSYATVAIRKKFTLTDISSIDSLVLQMNYDDGFVAYINGEEVARSNVSGANPGHDTLADSNHEQGTFETFNLSAHLDIVREGENVIAIQGHNVNLTSSDFSLSPILTAQKILSHGDEDSDRVVITARVRDEDSVGEVLLQYQRLYAPYGTGLLMDDWQSVPMFDDGTHGDLIAGDDIYTCILNDHVTIAPNELWRYKISATDGQGFSGVWPRQTEETRNFIFYVSHKDDVEQYPTFRLFMEQATWNWLNRNVSSDVEQPCVVVIDGEAFDLFHGGGTRFRGHVLRNKPKKSWKIRFPKDNRWEGKRAVNLNANYQTSALVRGEAGFMEHLAYEFFRQADVITPDSRGAEVFLNNDYYGLFIHTEQYNEDFLDNHNLPDNTIVFKAGVKARPSFMTKESSLATYQSKYKNMIGRSGDLDALIAFIEELNDTSTAGLEAFFENNVNIERYLNYLACVCVLSHVDATEKNYFPTRGADGLWFVSPWDISHSYGELHTINSYPFKTDHRLLDGADGGVFGTNRLRQRFLSVPKYKEMYYQRLREFVDHLFTNEHLDPLFDSYWEYLKEGIDRNVERWNSPGQLDRMVSEMKRYVKVRREFILRDRNVRPSAISATPEHLVPTDGSSVATREPMLSAKTVGDGSVAMAEWEVQAGGTDFAKPHWRMAVIGAGSIQVPANVLSSGQTYNWRMRWKLSASAEWSDWSDPTSFAVADHLIPGDVQNLVVTPLDRSVRFEWDLPRAQDLLRIDIYDGIKIVESTSPNDNRVRVTELENGEPYIFTIYTVSKDRLLSKGVTVAVIPVARSTSGDLIAYYRFEGDTVDQAGNFSDGTLLGDSMVTTPGAMNPIPLTQESNTGALHIGTQQGSGFSFGSAAEGLNIDNQLTIECYAKLDSAGNQPMVLVDRYDEANAAQDGVWRFGVNYSKPGSLDFFFNDGDGSGGFTDRLHIASTDAVFRNDGAFHHYAVVVDLRHDFILAKVTLYVDARPVAITVVHDNGESYYSSFKQGSDIPVLIGAKRTANGTGDLFPGKIDEVRITANNLKPQELLHLPDTEVLGWMLY
jgi:spore coat protein CotH